MATLLRVDASVRVEGSQSRFLGDEFETKWRAAHPGGVVITRDVVADPVVPLSEMTVAGMYTPEEHRTDAMREALLVSDELVGEFNGADHVLLNVPMYNYTVPAALKAWIEQVTRVNHTFLHDKGVYTGIAKVKKGTAICTYGSAGYQPGGGWAPGNFLSPYLEYWFDFLGIREAEVINYEGVNAGEETREHYLSEARKRVDAWAA